MPQSISTIDYRQPKFIHVDTTYHGYILCIYIYIYIYIYVCVCARTHTHKKRTVKTNPIAGPRYLEGSRKLRFPDYVTMTQDGGKVVSLTHRPLFTPQEILQVLISRPQGYSAIGRIMSMKNSNDTIWNRTSDFPIRSTAP